SQAFDPSNHGIKSDCEGKRLGAILKFDFEKTALVMKDSVDDAITNGKRLKTVFDCQVKDAKGELFSMELKSESIYLMRFIGFFVCPTDNTDMTNVLLNNLPILLWRSRELDIMIEALDQDAHDLQSWVRPSFE
ncbi:hypothetical protein BGZ65_002901, partial [Modicella reniformis]